MKPEDIANKTFEIAVRGYSRDEVDDYLSEVARHLDQLESRPTTSSVLADVDRFPGGHFEYVAQETQRILEAAQEAGESIREHIVQEAKEKARAQAKVEIQALQLEIEELNGQVSTLREQREKLSDTLRQVLQITEGS